MKFLKFDPLDYYDPTDLTNDQDADRLSPSRRPPVIRLYWIWAVIRVVSAVIAILGWLSRCLTAHHRPSTPSPQPSPATTADQLGAVVDGERKEGGGEERAVTTEERTALSIFPSFLVTAARWVDDVVMGVVSHPVLSHLLTRLHRLRMELTPKAWRAVTERPSTFLLWSASSLITGVLNRVLVVLNAVTGSTRSWVNVLDDSFDLQYLVQDLQPTHDGLRITRSGIGQVLQTPDVLYPYDRHARAGFTPIVTPLDVATAIMAKLAYEEVPTARDICQQWGLPPVVECFYDSLQAELKGDFYDMNFESRAFIFRYDTAAVVAFRGTYPTSAIQWLTDFSAQQIVYPGQRLDADPGTAVRVHRGFFSALGCPVVGDETSPESLFTEIVRRLNEPSFSRVENVYITGHSLGAALATMFSYALMQPGWVVGRPVQPRRVMATNAGHLRRYNVRTQKTTTVDTPSTAVASLAPAALSSKLQLGSKDGRLVEASAETVRGWMAATQAKVRGVYTFGSPRVGNDRFANAYDALYHNIPVHRFIHQADIITHLPPPVSGSTEPDAGVAFDYCHVDGLRFVDATQRVAFVVNQDAPPTPWTSLNMLDHNPGSYVRHINAALSAQMREVQAIKTYVALHQAQRKQEGSVERVSRGASQG